MCFKPRAEAMCVFRPRLLLVRDITGNANMLQGLLNLSAVEEIINVHVTWGLWQYPSSGLINMRSGVILTQKPATLASVSVFCFRRNFWRCYPSSASSDLHALWTKRRYGQPRSDFQRLGPAAFRIFTQSFSGYLGPRWMRVCGEHAYPLIVWLICSQ